MTYINFSDYEHVASGLTQDVVGQTMLDLPRYPFLDNALHCSALQNYGAELTGVMSGSFGPFFTAELIRARKAVPDSTRQFGLIADSLTSDLSDRIR